MVPKGHPLTREPRLTLEMLAEWPIITYQTGLTGRTRIDEAFGKAALSPEILLTAQDSDVIKTYVELEMGVGILADMAFDAQRDSNPGLSGCHSPVRGPYRLDWSQEGALLAQLRLAVYPAVQPRPVADRHPGQESSALTRHRITKSRPQTR